MKSLIKRVKETVERYRMLQGGERVLVACSGGSDSVFLLHALGELRQPYGLDLHVAHLDHQLRGAESKEDAHFVEALARKMGIPCTAESFDLPSYLQGRSLSTEEGARRVRYQFLERIAPEVRADRIATGHTASDQAETFLLRLIRGAGALGLSSIPPVRGMFIRPLIEISKRDILDYLGSNRIGYRVDSTNLTLCCTRNVVRNEVMPQLERLNPRVVDSLGRTAELLREEESLLADEVSEILPRVVKRQGQGEIVLDLPRFLQYNIPIKRRALREVVKQLKGDLLKVSFKDIDSILKLSQKGRTGSRVSLPSVLAERSYGELILTRGEDEEIGEWKKELVIPGTTSVDSSLKIHLEVMDSSDLPAQLDFQDRTYYDLERLSPPLLVRSRRRGDRFTPFGMDGVKKLKDLFIEEKIPRKERNRIPIVADQEGVLWVVGYRRSQRATVGPTTRKVLVVEKV